MVSGRILEKMRQSLSEPAHRDVAWLFAVFDVPEGSYRNPGELRHFLKRPFAFETIFPNAFSNGFLVCRIMHDILVLQNILALQGKNEGSE